LARRRNPYNVADLCENTFRSHDVAKRWISKMEADAHNAEFVEEEHSGPGPVIPL
jgi:hypothetical protein